MHIIDTCMYVWNLFVCVLEDTAALVDERVLVHGNQLRVLQDGLSRVFVPNQL